MAAAATLLKDLENPPLLSAAQLQEVRDKLAVRFSDPSALLKELVRREWLTEFQARSILKGHASQLLLGSYLIVDALGKGAGGQIFKARHTRTNQLVALKVLHRELVKDQSVVQRFHREIEVASHIAHPNIVHAIEAGQMGPALVLAMEFVPGINLERLVEKSGPLSAAKACACARQVALGLDCAGQQGLVHRDIKPANLLVDAQGVVKILDLGLARLTEYVAGSQTHDMTLHESKAVMQGTPDFMAPEQALDFHQADTRADIYSLGCTLFYLLSGKPPFSATSLAQKLMKHQQLEAPVETLPIEPALAAVLRKMLAKRPEDRYQTPAEVVQALTPFCGPGALTNKLLGGSTRKLPVIRRFWGRLPVKARLAVAGTASLALLTFVLWLWPKGSATDAATGNPLAASQAEVVPAKITSYGESFRGPEPAPGWRYLWNQSGAVGNPDNYVPLMWVASISTYDMDGMPSPSPGPPGYVRLNQGGGHPGRHANGYDRCAIAAYTLQPQDGAGPYYLIRSSIGRGNHLRVIVHVNNRQPPARDVKIPANPNPPAHFDCNLGILKPGDTVYVCVGPDGSDSDDTFDQFDFTLFRGQPSPEDRPLVPRATTNAFEYSDIVAEVAPGFTIGGLRENRLALLAEHRGRKRVLQTHPQSQEIPCILTRRLRIPAGKQTFLLLDVSHHPEGNWQLVVNASGQTLLDEKIAVDTTKDGWAHFRVNLTPFAGRDITLEVMNAANDWHHEWGFWSRVALESP